MITFFDVNKLRKLLRDFYEISHIRITVFDANLEELVSYPTDIPPFCQLIRSSEKGMDACRVCDENACAAAGKQGKTHIYQCHAGLMEAVTPLYVEDVLVGYLLLGHVFSYPSVEEGWLAVRSRCLHLPVDMEKLEAACRERPLTELSYVHSAAQILHAVASYLILERMAILQTDRLAVRLNGYIAAHYTEPLKADALCRTLGIGKTQLYKLSAQLYGCGIAEHIRGLRLEAAKSALEKEPHRTIAEIAAACGFHDYNYFIAMFTREIGVSPGAYRKRYDRKCVSDRNSK